jgi:hypothetical protein
MIRTQAEYKTTTEQVRGFKARLEAKEKELKKMELTAEQVSKIIAPEIAFFAQLEAEAESYERLCRGDVRELDRFREFRDLGKFLIALRLFRGLTQNELAERLHVDPSQISRDEKNEYYGISYQRVVKILDALGACLQFSYKPSEAQREMEYA